MAMTAWSAKVCSRGDLPGGEATDLGAGDADDPDRLALAHHRHRERPAEGRDGRERGQGVVGVGLGVRDVGDASLQDGAAGRGAAGGRGGPRGPGRRERRGPQPVMGHEVQDLPVEAEDEAHLGLAEPGRAVRDRVEDRLDVGGRARDDPQDLAGRGLLLERLGEIVIALPHLGEEADVLDRDDRLGREGLEQRDLDLGEGTGRGPGVEHDDADRGPVAQHRHRQDSAHPGSQHPGENEVAVRLRILDVDGAALQDRPPGRVPVGHRGGIRLTERVRAGEAHVGEGHEVDQLAVVGEHRGGVGLAEAPGVARDGVEDRLHVGG